MATTKTQPKNTSTRPAKEPVEPSPVKFKPVKPDEIAWAPAETGEGMSAIVRGYELSVRPIMGDAAEGEEPKPTGRWLWSVSAAAEVSETPEESDADQCATEGGGQRWARQTLNRHLKSKKES